MKQLFLSDLVPVVHQKEPPAPIISWRLFVDGASRNNPGASGAGLCLLKGDQVFLQEGYYLGIKTNNQAEYLAFLLGLFVIERHITPYDSVTILADSQLLVRQINGEYRVKQQHLKPLHALAVQGVSRFSAQVQHVMREGNQQADEMANYGIDRKVLPPAAFIEHLGQHGILL